MPLATRGLELPSIAIGNGKYQNRWKLVSNKKKQCQED
jgi:hypothetical protein